MARDDVPSVGRIVLFLGAFLIVGVPIVAVLWSALNAMMAGDIARVVVVVPALAAFVVFLVIFGRRLRRLE